MKREKKETSNADQQPSTVITQKSKAYFSYTQHFTMVALSVFA